MCGIAGIIALNNNLTSEDKVTVESMTAVLKHRGPDNKGFHFSRNCFLGNTRLAIIDPSEQSNLPLADSEEQIWICYNGEVSNFKELKKKYNLENKYQFKGHSDTEVLLYLYKELGINFINELSGMFAFCLLDKLNNKAYLVRDFYGIIPLFYKIESDKIYFASEIKSFLEIPSFKKEINKEAIYHFFSLAYIPGNNTPFVGVEEMRGGEMISINLNNGSYEKSVYYDFDYTEDHSLDFETARKNVRDLFVDSVRRNLVSDAPLGMTLSGGIDTSSMLGVVHHLGLSEKMHTFSLKMGEKSFDESPFQRLMAKRCNTQHHEIVVSPDDVIENMITQISYMDEPNGNGASIPSFILAKEASKHVKVLLSGEGGDEVFNAYPTIGAYQYRKYYRLAPKPIRSLIRNSIHLLPANYKKLSFDFKAKRFTRGAELDVPDAHLYWRHVFNTEEKHQLFKNKYPSNETESFYRDLFYNKVSGHDINRISYIDMKHFFLDDLMVKNDRTFLANSVEGRFPLMDRYLVEYATKLPVKFRVKGLNGLRHIQKEALKEFLPDEIYKRQSFGLEMPHSIWFLDKLGYFAEKYLNKKYVDRTELLDWETISIMWNLHKSGKADYGRPIWCVLNYLIWFDLFVDSNNYKDYWKS